MNLEKTSQHTEALKCDEDNEGPCGRMFLGVVNKSAWMRRCPPGDPSLITGLVAFLYLIFPLRHMLHDRLALPLRRHLAS
jgi:hypothetical protein